MSLKHQFAPAMPKQQKVSLDCSIPQPTSSVKRFTTALPLPTDIADALNYGATYIDHAAYLAKHAIQQFECLKKDHSDLTATAEARAKQIASLQCQVKDLQEKHHGLEHKYDELEKQRAREAKEAKAREDLLRKELADTRAALKASEGTVARLRKHIDQDKLEDIERERQHDQHISADHLRIEQLEKRATKAEAEVAQLKTSLDATNKKLVVAEANLKTTREKLSASEAAVAKLTKELDAETKAKVQLQAELKAANVHLQEAHDELVHLRSSNAAKDVIIKNKQTTIDAMQKTIDDNKKTIEEKEKSIAALQKEIEAKKATIAEKEKTIAEKQKKIEEKQSTIDEKDDELARLREDVENLDKEIARVRRDLTTKTTRYTELERKYKALEGLDVKAKVETVDALKGFKDPAVVEIL